MRPFWENCSIKHLKTAVWVLLCVCPVEASAVTIGPAVTKRERQAASSRDTGSRGVRYESVMNAFLSGDYASSEELAGHYMTHHSKEKDAEDVAYLRALSLMKLGRFDEARPLLEELSRQASSETARARAAYSLGDSYYFQNRRKEADLAYREALERYPNAGEAYTVRRILGLSFGSAAGPRALGQFGVEEAAPAQTFSVQVGAFSSERNAQRLLNKLLRNRYDAFVTSSSDEPRFHVRVGRVGSAEEAKKLAARLDKDGYPTKIAS